MAQREQLKIKQFHLVQQIYRGPNSLVYLANHEFIDRKFVIKLLRFGDEQAIQRVHREIRTLAMLHHPNNVQIVDAGVLTAQQDTALPYIALEYVPGQTLRHLLANQGRLGAELTVRIALQVLYALDEAHSRGMVHRDVKPENLVISNFIRNHFTLKVIDYGIANPVDHTTIHAPTFTSEPNYGTPHYMAPEYIENKAPSSPRADIYSLGVVMYECLSGRRPFEGAEMMSVLYQHVHTEPKRLSELIPIHRGLADVVDCAMSKDPSRRYANASAFIDALLALSPDELRTYNPAGMGMNSLVEQSQLDTMELESISSWERDRETTAPSPALREVSVEMRSNQRPIVWVLEGAPSLASPVVEHALQQAMNEASVQVIPQADAERALLALRRRELDPPWVVLFGDMHVILESELLGYLAELGVVARLLISTHANADLFVEAAQFSGVDDQLTHPFEAEQLLTSIRRAVARTRGILVKMDDIRTSLRYYRERTMTLTRKLTNPDLR